jgi:hypothetical protein
MSYIVENVGDVIEDSEDGVHARPVVLDHWRSDEFGVERIPERMKTIQREVGENVDALADQDRLLGRCDRVDGEKDIDQLGQLQQLRSLLLVYL